MRKGALIDSGSPTISVHIPAILDPTGAILGSADSSGTKGHVDNLKHVSFLLLGGQRGSDMGF